MTKLIPRWRDYVLLRGAMLSDFWTDHCRSCQEPALFVLAKSFDPRSCLGIETLVNSAAARRADARVLLFPNEQSLMSADLLKRAEDNFKRIHETIGPRGTVTPHALQFFSAEGRRVASQNAARVFTKSDELSQYSDVIVDISGMPRSIFFPLVGSLLFLLDRDSAIHTNLFVVVSEDAALDANIGHDQIEEFADFLPTFRGGFALEATAELPKVWIPILGESRLVQLDRIYDVVKPDEVCPILPSPARNPRRGDNLVREYHDFLFDTLRVDPRDFIYAAEQNPFEVYRQIHRAVLQYNDSLKSLGGCKVALSALSSKLMSMGALLAAYELKSSDMDVGVAHIECNGYGMTDAKTDSELFGMWLAGTCYERENAA